jgi:serine phosphatase RsbU (regulator of sigma subunit)
VTMVAGVFDPKTNDVLIANAGHEPPLIYRGGDEYEGIEADAPPVGIVPPIDDSPFPETTVNLNDSILYVFTDGVTEGYDPNGEPLEVDGLKSLLDQNKGSSMQNRLESVASFLQDVPTPLRDDITLLAIEGRKTN